jgi:hypothetical protein
MKIGPIDWEAVRARYGAPAYLSYSLKPGQVHSPDEPICSATQAWIASRFGCRM